MAPFLRKTFTFLFQIAVSPVTFVVLSIAWCLDLAVGSILAYRADPRFWVQMDAYPFNVWLRDVAPDAFPGSLWVYLLVGLTYLVVASLVLCTANWFFRRRRNMHGMGEVLVHLGFLLIFLGFVLGSGFGTRVQGIQVAEGEASAVGDTAMALRLDGVDAVRGPGGRVWDIVSRVALLRDGRAVAEGIVKTNHPLIWGSTVVYPQGAYARVTGAAVATSDGTFTLRRGESVELSDGGRLVMQEAVDPGDRRGPYFGPGVLVARTDASGRTRGNAFLAPGRVGFVDLDGIRVRLLDLNIVPNGVYNVHGDPGVKFVFWGALVLTVGTFWALLGYLRRRQVAP